MREYVREVVNGQVANVARCDAICQVQHVHRVSANGNTYVKLNVSDSLNSIDVTLKNEEYDSDYTKGTMLQLIIFKIAYNSERRFVFDVSHCQIYVDLPVLSIFFGKSTRNVNDDRSILPLLRTSLAQSLPAFGVAQMTRKRGVACAGMLSSEAMSALCSPAKRVRINSGHHHDATAMQLQQNASAHYNSNSNVGNTSFESSVCGSHSADTTNTAVQQISKTTNPSLPIAVQRPRSSGACTYVTDRPTHRANDPDWTAAVSALRNLSSDFPPLLRNNMLEFAQLFRENVNDNGPPASYQ